MQAAVFPGQGSQAPGMAKAVIVASGAAKRLFARANDVLGFDITSLCVTGTADQLEPTDVQQPAIFLTSAALWEALLEAGVPRAGFVRMGGLSLGEYTALYASGAIGFDDALRLVRLRGRLMQEAAIASPSGMASLIGADEKMAAELCDRARGSDVLALANFNCPGQIVISGSRSAIDRAVELAASVGCRAVTLAVAGAFHSPLMQPASDGLAKALESTVLDTPRVSVTANVSGEYHAGPHAIRDSLCRQLTQPVRWQRCVERMIADGVTRFVEIGPGRVLTGLLRKINRDTTGLAVNGPDGFAQCLETQHA